VSGLIKIVKDETVSAALEGEDLSGIEYRNDGKDGYVLNFTDKSSDQTKELRLKDSSKPKSDSIST
jgi:hypothetical protein